MPVPKRKFAIDVMGHTHAKIYHAHSAYDAAVILWNFFRNVDHNPVLLTVTRFNQTTWFAAFYLANPREPIPYDETDGVTNVYAVRITEVTDAKIG